MNDTTDSRPTYDEGAPTTTPPAAPATWTDARDVTIPLEEGVTGQLVLSSGASHLNLRADPTLTALCRAHFDGAIPEVRASAGRVAITYPRFWPLGWLRAGLSGSRMAADIALSTRVPWEIVVRGGVSHLDASLEGLDVRSFQITGGASHVALALPRPTGTVSLRIGGGASEIVVRRPAGVPVRLSMHGGASRLSFDEMRFGAIGGGFAWQSPDYRDATARFEISLTGGASRITIAEA